MTSTHSSSQSPAAVSIVGPPGVEPVLAISVPTASGRQAGEAITLATAAELVRELQKVLTAINGRAQ